MKSRKTIGPKNASSGTPDVTGDHRDAAPPVMTPSMRP